MSLMAILVFVALSMALFWALLLLAVSTFFRGMAFIAVGAILINHRPPEPRQRLADRHRRRLHPVPSRDRLQTPPVRRMSASGGELAHRKTNVLADPLGQAGRGGSLVDQKDY